MREVVNLSLVGAYMSDNTAYYRQRARIERKLAKEVSHANVAAIHEELAGLYEALVSEAELRPRQRLSIPSFRAAG